MTVEIPVDIDGNTIDSTVVQEVVQAALDAPPGLTLDWLQAALHELQAAHAGFMVRGSEYDIAVRLAGRVLRYVNEHRNWRGVP